MTDYRETLRRIRTFPALIKFLQEELDWPIISGDFEELTFEYTPEELGIDEANAAKIREIKRLRPLSVNQPWGIFFVMFEPKRLPVVALRRILSRVVLKKRASANSAERAGWQADDLLFVSNYGEGDERQISFAHFAQPGQKDDLPTLKVLGWDNLDTPLHLDHVADMLVGKLFWPDDPDDLEKWRKTWRSAFTLRHQEVINTSKDLAVRLAELARAIRDRIKTVLDIETANGPLTRLMKAFQEALVHDLDADGFADMYAQTIAYGLLSARVENPLGKTADDLAAQMPVTNPFLKELMETFLDVGGRKEKVGRGPGLDFDELGVSEVVELLDAANMQAVVRDFGDRKPEEDPVIHFYELFLKEYDAKKKIQRGVFYTPRPVVSYIVRSVDELLRTEFGLADGLADTAAWGEMAKRHEGLQIPQGMKPGDAFVQILDPATGTGTFLVEVIDLIHKTMTKKWQAQGHGAKEIGRLWNDYVPQHLLPRLYGYELLMAPYAIAHMKIGLKLYETGYRFDSDERVRVYLTNTLEPAHDFSDRFAFAIPALAHEAQAVNAVKRHQRFTVVLGNPPYSLLSSNMDPQHRALVEPYKFVCGQRIHERGALQLEKNINDDYVKFIRFTQLTINHAKVGIAGLITNHSFLDNPTMRGVRWNLMSSVSRIWVNDLHGNSTKKEQPPVGGENVNVFQIKQGVAITLMARLPNPHGSSNVYHHERWGSREEKEVWLAANLISSHPWQTLEPAPDLYLFVPQNNSLKNEFEVYPSLPDAMPINGAGYITARDNLVVDFEWNKIVERIRRFNASQLDDGALLEAFEVSDKKGWDVSRARRELRPVDIAKRVIKTNYRPFDTRWIFYDSTLVWGRSWPTLQHVVSHPQNITLLATRMTKDQWDVWVARTVSSHKAMSAYDTNSVFPLFLVEDSESRQRSIATGHRINFSPPFLRALAVSLGVPQKGAHGLPQDLAPEDIFQYAYAVFHSPDYRSRYAEFLKIDFPRLPLTSSLELFRALARLGGELVALHLVEAPVQQALSARYDQPAKAWRYDVTPSHRLPVALTFTGPAAPVVDKVGWSDDTAWLDAAATKKGQPATPGTIGFRGVPEAVWNFHIGGYQVCHKWLKDRKGRTLSADDLIHYHSIVIALHETIRLMMEIDEVIDQHGGWPAAFANSAPGRS
jgi:predicted helicase